MIQPEANADYLEPLNDEQRAAVLHGDETGGAGRADGPLLVIAGAGTGKTTTLAHRVAHLVLAGVQPERILLLTFSRRAAQEMIRRAERIVAAALAGRGQARPVDFAWAGTFHSVANRLLRRYAACVGLDPAFSVLDRGDSADLIDLTRHELGLSAKNRRFPGKDTCLKIYSLRVNSGKSLHACLTESFPWCQDDEDELTALFRAYVERKQASAALDYDDLLLYWHHLSRDDELAAEIGAAFSHVLVDEYQDTNRLQADILLRLKPDGAGVTVVGDDAQSIYAFRAAEVDNILSFPDRFMPSARVVTLARNYRSVQPVLDTANALINEAQRQYRKDLYTARRSEQRPWYVTVEDTDAEADYVVQGILAERERGTLLRHQAVLFRSSHHSDRLELELVRRDIPYVKYGGLKFLEAAHVKDFLAVLKWADNPRNQVAAFRVLKLMPGFGPATAGRCFERVAAGDFRLAALAGFRPPPAAAAFWRGFVDLMTLLAGSDAAAAGWQSTLAPLRSWYAPLLAERYEASESRLADLDQLVAIGGNYPSRERYLSELTLDPPQASGDLAGDAPLDEDYLVLSTVHSAKGQEWDSVYVLNVTDGNFPSEFATGRPDGIEEERRLLYVAMTRARNELHLLAPLKFPVTAQQRHGDRHVYGARSRFLSDTLLATLEPRFHASPVSNVSVLRPKSGRTIDVAARLRDMW